MRHDSCSWKITSIIDESPRAKTLVLQAIGERPQFIPGQYLTVRLPHFEPAEGKAYSIASSPSETTVRLTVKAMGAFSLAILAHTVGDTLHTSLPYGFFYPEIEEGRDLAFIAGGIGITPCMSIMQNLSECMYPHQLFLFYSNPTLVDTIFKNKLDALSQTNTNIHIIHHITQEVPPVPHMKVGRMTGRSICETLNTPTETDFFICGSTSFTKSLWKELKSVGLDNSQLYTEGFF